MNIVLLRGLAREAGHWLGFSQRLRAHLEQHLENNYCVCENERINILTPDFPGCGKYFQSPALASIADMTNHVRKELTTKETPTETTPTVTKRVPDEKLIVIGLSMGGMVALDWLARFPQEVTSVVLINSSLGHHPLHWRIQSEAWLTVGKSFFLSPQEREKLILRLVSNDEKQYEKNQLAWLEIQKQHPVSMRTASKMLLSAKNFKLEHWPTDKPGLVLTAKQDRLVSHKCSENIAAKGHWPLYTHPWAGHDLPLDDGEWVCEKISHWLKTYINNPVPM